MALTDPIPSAAADVFKRNVEDADRFVNSTSPTLTTRLNYTKKTLSGIEAELDAAIAAGGYVPVSGSFEAGGTVSARNEVLLYEADGYYYKWAGTLPKVVSAVSTPATAGGVGAGFWTAVGGIDTGFFATRTVAITGGLNELDLRYDNFDSATGSLLDLDLQTSTRQYFFALVDGASNAYSITGDNQITLNTTSSGGEVVKVWQNHPDKAFRYVFDTISDLDSTDLIYTGQIVFVAGYTTVGDGGGGKFKIVEAATGTDDGGSYFDLSGSGLQAERLFGSELSVRQWGGFSGDITTELTAAITYSKANLWLPVLLDIPSFSLSSALPQLNSSFDYVKLVGLGRNKTIIDVTGAGDDIFSYVGGSGRIAGTVIEGVSIDGDATQEPISIKGFCGPRFKECEFNFRTAAKLSNDIAVGTFTEFVVFDSCELNVESVFTMVRGAGNDSFHGCGWTEATVINQKSGGTRSLVELGALTDTGRCVWYNGPVNGTIFVRSDLPLFTEGNANLNMLSTYGTLAIERASPSTLVTFSDVVHHVHSGDIISFSAPITYGTMDLTAYAAATASGNFNGIKQGVIDSDTFTVSPAGSIDIPGAIDRGAGGLAFVSFSGTNWEYLLLVGFAGRISGGISPAATTIATLRSFNTSGWGAPVLTMGDTQLSASNASWTGNITVRVTMLPSAIRYSPFL